MIEALFAMALMGLIVGGLATVTAQWLPNWNRGLMRVVRNEQVAIALDRISADLSAAQYVSANRTRRIPLFQGLEESVVLVRSAVGPNSRPGLEIVRIAEMADRDGVLLTRMRAPFVPLPIGDLSIDSIPFADPVVLLRAPFRVAFAYAGPDGIWMNSWRNAGDLPAAVRIIVGDAMDGHPVVASTATRIHVDMMAPLPQQVSEPPSPAAQAQPGNAPGTR
jgi:general secretion pathway protein J